jgi:hypothetical protein
MTRFRRVRRLALAASVAALILPLSAAADDDPRDEARREGTCTRSSDVELRLRGDDGRIRVELEIETGRRGARWRVIVLHERRTAFRGEIRTGSDGALELRRNVPDWYGTDTVVVRASGPRAETCRVAATL